MNKLIGVLILGVMFIGVLNLVLWTVKKTEIKECIRLQKQSEEYPGFYSTSWQKDQCEFHNLKLSK